MEEILKKYKEAKASLDRAVRELREKAAAEAGPWLVKHFFGEGSLAREHLSSIVITGYIPYFNDGEPCSFWLLPPQVEFGAYPGYEVEDFEFGDWRWEDDQFKELVPEKVYEDVAQEIHDKFSLLGQDLMNTIFGDHFRLTISPTGMDTEEYVDHD